MPQFAYESLVTEAPLSEVAALYEAWRSKTIGSRRAALAAINFASFGANLLFPDDGSPAPFGGLGSDGTPQESWPAIVYAVADDAAIESAFQSLLPDADGTMKAGVGSGAWLLILTNVVLPLLVRILKK